MKYMYAGKIENLNTRSPRLLEAADKYQLSELKEICEETLCDNLTVDTCLECLVLADLHTAEDLKKAAIKFVVDHSEDFVDQVLSSAARSSATPYYSYSLRLISSNPTLI